MNICKVCGVEISNNRVFCSNKCKEKHAKSDFVLLKASSHDLSGITDEDISNFSFRLIKFIISNSPM